jgi:release factor glutamine methyltransferase
LLVEEVISRLRANQPSRILDLGTGSGVLAITIARLCPQADVTAVDSSDAALAVAQENAARLNAGRVRFVKSDWYSALDGDRFDLIVSNPPYVATGDPHLEQGDLRFEPRQALVGGKDGLDSIRVLVEFAADHLQSGGWLLFEHGHDQATACRELLQVAQFESVCSATDLAGIERVTGGQIGLR